MANLRQIMRLPNPTLHHIEDSVTTLLRLSFVLAFGVFAVKGDGCTLGRSNLPRTSPNTTPGLFIDRSNPSSCSGQIIQWRVCFYNPRDFSTRDSLQIRLQTWRFNNSRGVRISNYMTTLNVPQRPATFQCVNIDVDTADYVDVEQGDYIGVATFNNSVLPVITNTDDGSRVLFLSLDASVSSMQLSNQAILVSATIVTPSSEVTPAVIDSTSPMETDATQDTTSSLDQVDLESGGIAAIVIMIFIVITATLLAVAGILCCVRARKKKNAKNIVTIDNAAYEMPHVHQENNDTINYNNMSTSGFYEVPIKTTKKTSREQRDYEESNVITNSGFVESTFDQASQAIERKDEKLGNLSSYSNTYATLKPVVFKDYYNTYFQHQNADHIYTIPDVPVEAPYSEPPKNEEDIYKELFKRTRTINRKNIEITKKVGEGAFSTVSKGSWTDGSFIHEVAVKELIKQSTKEDKIKMLQEAAILGQFRHPNIVNLFGVVKHGSAPMIVTEFLHKSDLLNVLLGIVPDPGQLVAENTPELLLSYSQQVCLGMHYLSSKGFVHRDLAARNIFVTENNICKVGDFGLSRELTNTDYYLSHGGIVPVRWTAPEAIFYRKYSSASDVWSYGCLLYEIWTLGIMPYDGVDPTKYLETLQAGYRLPPPPGCPLIIYRTMIKCWNPKASERPNFTHILSVLLNETLSIPIKDASTHSQACQLGASLEAGLDMYIDLQNAYRKTQTSPKQKHCSVTSIHEPSRTTQTPAEEEDLYEPVDVQEM